MFLVCIFLIIIMTLCMVGFGYMFLKRPPKDINGLFGYRTAMSMKNQDTWNFAHKVSGKYWFYSGIISGIIYTIVAFVIKNINITSGIVYLIEGTYLLVMLSVIPVTEIKLKKRFDKDGKLKNET